MKWIVTTPPASYPITYDQAASHLNLINGVAQDYISNLLIPAAVGFAQEEMGCSLLTQTITATYFLDDVAITPPVVSTGPTLTDPFNNPVSAATIAFGTNGRSPVLRLKRGPVASVVSVVDANGNPIASSLECIGHQDQLRLTVAALYPVTVVYTAGFGSDASSVPPEIIWAMLAHVGTMYENRESAAERPLTAVPHSLADFYRRRSRYTGVG